MEVYQNYTLLLFKNMETKEVRRFELPLDELDMEMLVDTITSNQLITFNGMGYDMPLLQLVLRGDTSLQIKKASDRIIVQNLKPWNFEKEFHVKVNPPEIDHVDLMEVAPLTGGLKLYGGRLHSKSLQDLPIPPGKVVTAEDIAVLRTYCENDCDTLTDLRNALKVQSELRNQMSKTYGIDLRSKSDAQIAEAVIKKEVEAITKRRIEKPGQGAGDRFHYKIPGWMGFRALNILDSIRDAWFVITDKGGVLMPPELKDRKITLSQGVYRMGVGGLHSSETRQVVAEDDTHCILDVDVQSYYPAILINQGLYPRHIGPEFLKVYQSLVDRRLAAKAAGNKTVSESLKISINGTFGKLGSKWSTLYSPDLMIQVTVTGQLALLMLIEALDETMGVRVVSANTDGVTFRCRRDCVEEAKAAVKDWETITGFTMETNSYRALYSRDVNSYVAICTDGSVKTKGAYGSGLPLHKNIMHPICSKAVIAYVKDGSDIAKTIADCDDVRQFLCMRTVKGGAIWRGEEVGKIVRYYHAAGVDEAILYKVNNYLVPDTYGVRPAVALPPGIPDDLNRQWYLDKAKEMLEDLGVV